MFFSVRIRNSFDFVLRVSQLHISLLGAEVWVSQPLSH
jgi:hypothetical protein